MTKAKEKKSAPKSHKKLPVEDELEETGENEAVELEETKAVELEEAEAPPAEETPAAAEEPPAAAAPVEALSDVAAPASKSGVRAKILRRDRLRAQGRRR
jgi:hypothetical protein